MTAYDRFSDCGSCCTSSFSTNGFDFRMGQIWTRAMTRLSKNCHIQTALPEDPVCGNPGSAEVTLGNPQAETSTSASKNGVCCGVSCMRAPPRERRFCPSGNDRMGYAAFREASGREKADRLGIRVDLPPNTHPDAPRRNVAAKRKTNGRRCLRIIRRHDAERGRF